MCGFVDCGIYLWLIIKPSASRIRLGLEIKSMLESMKEVTSRSALSRGLLSAYVLPRHWWAHIEMRARRDAASC